MNHASDLDQTIAAMASPPGAAARGIVRISGGDAVSIVDACFEPSEHEFKNIQRPYLQHGHLIAGSSRIPGSMLVWPTKRSFTRQPSAEFHTFGSPPVLQMCLEAFTGAGARLARPGEFTMRAFLCGRIDLVQAEAILAVIDAQDRKQLDVALDQLAGGLGGRLQETRSQLIAGLAELEAGLDFVEEDIEFISADELLRKLRAAASTIESVLSQISRRDSTSSQFTAGLFGLPNAGKSSLFNCLVDEQAAIVSDVQGTTTDAVSRTITIGQLEIQLVDTAGLENDKTKGTIAHASQQHRQSRRESCDLVIECIDATDFFERGVFDGSVNDSHPCVITRVDLLDASRRDELESQPGLILTSVESGQGIGQLQNYIHDSALNSQSVESGVVGSTVLRSRESLVQALDSIRQAIAAAEDGFGEEIVAAEIRHALDSLGLVVGTIYADDILDVVFGKFCIGK